MSTPPAHGPDTGGVRLVSPGAEHVAMLVQLGRDQDYRRWGEGTDTDTDAAARAWAAVARRRWLAGSEHTPRQWVVEVSDRGTWAPAGLVECRRDGRGAGEVGYAVHPAFRGRGVATSALRLAVDHAFDVDRLSLLTWRAEVGNWASRRVAWRVGFPAPHQVRGLLRGTEGTGPREGWISSLAATEARTPAHAWREPPLLERDGVRLRAWRDDERDVGAVGRVDQVARTYVGPILPATDPAGVRAWLTRQRHGMASGSSVVWCIADATHDGPLGYLSLFNLQQPFAAGCADVGYWLLPAGRGRGAVTAALRLAASHAFTDLAVHRIAARTDARNAASQRALLRAGFRWVATESQSCVYAEHGPRQDTATFELLVDPAAQAAPRPGPPPGVAAGGGHP